MYRFCSILLLLFFVVQLSGEEPIRAKELKIRVSVEGLNKENKSILFLWPISFDDLKNRNSTNENEYEALSSDAFASVEFSWSHWNWKDGRFGQKFNFYIIENSMYRFDLFVKNGKYDLVVLDQYVCDPYQVKNMSMLPGKIIFEQKDLSLDQKLLVNCSASRQYRIMFTLRNIPNNESEPKLEAMGSGLYSTRSFAFLPTRSQLFSDSANKVCREQITTIFELEFNVYGRFYKLHCSPGFVNNRIAKELKQINTLHYSSHDYPLYLRGKFIECKKSRKKKEGRSLEGEV